ncbi:MAG: hypothetical protein ACYTET_08195, partial [Planctomycetota bacterium]
GNLPEIGMHRQGVEGWFVDKVPMDSRVTVFSRFGGMLDIGLIVGFITLFVTMIIESWKRKHSRGSQTDA